MLELTFFGLYVSVSQIMKPRYGADSLRQVADWISSMSLQLIVGENIGKCLQKKEKVGIGADIPFLKSSIREVFFCGKACSSSLQKTTLMLQNAKWTNESSYALFLSYVTRTSFIVGLALLGRYMILSFNPLKALELSEYHDRICLLFSFTVLVSGQLVFVSILPNSWFWKNNLSAAGKNWIESEYLEKAILDSPWREKWKKIESNESYSGARLSEAKVLLREDWVNQKILSERQSFRLVESCLPLFEFVCGGLAAVLVLIIPGLMII